MVVPAHCGCIPRMRERPSRLPQRLSGSRRREQQVLPCPPVAAAQAGNVSGPPASEELSIRPFMTAQRATVLHPPLLNLRNLFHLNHGRNLTLQVRTAKSLGRPPSLRLAALHSHVVAQFLQAARSCRSDASCRYAQLITDVLVGDRRLADEQDHESALLLRQLGEDFSDHDLTLGPQQPVVDVDAVRCGPRIVGRRSRLVRTGKDLWVNWNGPLPGSQVVEAVTAGCRGNPSGQCLWVTDGADMLHKLQPQTLADVFGISRSETVLADDRTDKWLVALYQCRPRVLVTFDGVLDKRTGIVES